MIYISGDENDMSDKLFWSFGSKGNAFDIDESLTDFSNKNYPLQQNNSCKEFKVPSKLFSWVMSCICGECLIMGQLAPQVERFCQKYWRHW